MKNAYNQSSIDIALQIVEGRFAFVLVASQSTFQAGPERRRWLQVTPAMMPPGCAQTPLDIVSQVFDKVRAQKLGPLQAMKLRDIALSKL